MSYFPFSRKDEAVFYQLMHLVNKRTIALTQVFNVCTRGCTYK